MLTRVLSKIRELFKCRAPRTLSDDLCIEVESVAADAEVQPDRRPTDADLHEQQTPRDTTFLRPAPTYGSAEQAAVDALDKNIFAASHKHCINVLPILPNFDIQNLYPITDCVEQWNILVVGSDKTYILASLKDPFIRLEPRDIEVRLPNKHGNEVLPPELDAFFEPVWDKTLLGKQLQFYIIWNDRLYFINTFPFFNSAQAVIGAILFMRNFHAVPTLNAMSSLEVTGARQRNSIDDTRAPRMSHEETLECVTQAATVGGHQSSRMATLEQRCTNVGSLKYVSKM